MLCSPFRRSLYIPDDKCLCCGVSTRKECGTCKTRVCSDTCNQKGWEHHKLWCGNKAIRPLLSKATSNICLRRSVALNVFLLALSQTPSSDCDMLLNMLREKVVVFAEGAENDEVVFNQDFSTKELVLKHLSIQDETMHFSGCRLSLPILLSICVTKDGRLSRELVAMMVWLYKCLHTEGNPLRAHPCLGWTIDPRRTIDSQNRYELPCSLVSLSQVLKVPKRTFMFWIQLTPEREGTTLTRRDLTPENAWDNFTRMEPSSEHAFIVMKVNDEVVLLQSYFGYYTFNQWIDFENPLELGEDFKKPKNPSWTRKLDPAPTFRGVFKATDVLLGLAATVESLKKEGNHIAAYQKLTGVIHDEKSIAKSYRIVFCCLNLDHLFLINDE